MTRRRFTEKDVLHCLAWQGIFVTCYRCKQPFWEVRKPSLEECAAGASMTGMISVPLRKPEREHLHEYGLDGPDSPANCRYSCSDCHKVITNGTKATTAGSSKNRIAKATHKNRTDKFVVNKPAPGVEAHAGAPAKPKSQWLSRPMQSGPKQWPRRKLQHGRPLPKRGSRPMNRKRRA